MKLTPWFPPDVKPVHVGVYETLEATCFPNWYDIWDGKNWWIGGKTPKSAMKNHQDEPRLLIQSAPVKWRGLAEKP